MSNDIIHSQSSRKWRMPDRLDLSTYFSGRYRDSEVISVPVRQHLIGNGRIFTLLACVDLEFPDRFFNQVEISKQNEMNITKEINNMKILQNLLTNFPISWKAFRKAEAKLHYIMNEKLGIKKQNDFFEKEEIKCKDNVNDTAVNEMNNDDDNDDDDECYGGVLGVYARGD